MAVGFVAVACATAPRPSGVNSEDSVAEPDAPVFAQTPDAAPASEVGDALEAAPPPLALQGPPLAWVNPARCHPACAFDPTPALVRVNVRGALDPKGRFLVAAEVQEPLQALIAAAWSAGHKVRLSSAYRSYEEQARVFAATPEVGRAARPGHSEHQLGTAVDLRLPFAAAADWLRENAPGYGFVLSYPEGRQRITGYQPEPWHFRFVGVEVAELGHERGWSLEEVFRAYPELGESGGCGDCPSPDSRAPCGEVTESGVCAGTVLTWCYGGTLTSVDCAATQQTCGESPETGAADCR